MVFATDEANPVTLQKPSLSTDCTPPIRTPAQVQVIAPKITAIIFLLNIEPQLAEQSYLTPLIMQTLRINKQLAYLEDVIHKSLFFLLGIKQNIRRECRYEDTKGGCRC